MSQETEHEAEAIDEEVSSFIDKGWDLMNQGNPLDAIESFNRAGESHEAVLGKAYAFLELGEEERAIACYDDMILRNNEDADWITDKASILNSMGRYPEAAQEYAKLVDRFPDNLDFLDSQALALRFANEDKQALDLYENALRDNPDNVKLLSGKADLLIELNQIPDALECLEKAANSPEGTFKASEWRSRADNLLWVDSAAAMHCYDKALENDPLDAMALMGKGKAIVNEGKDFETALRCFERATELAPGEYIIYFEMANTLYRLERYEEALAYYDKVTNEDPNHIYAWANRGLCQELMQNYQDALDAFSKAIEIDEKYAWAWERRAGVLDELGRKGEAIRNYRRALELDENLFWSNNNLGHLLFNYNNDPEGAIRYFDRAILIDPSEALPHTNKSITLVSLGRAQEGYDGLLEALDNVTDKGEILEYLAGLAFDGLSNPKLSIQHYAEMERQGYKGFSTDLCMAEVYLSLNECAEAKKKLAQWREQAEKPNDYYVCIAAFFDFALVAMQENLNEASKEFDEFIRQFKSCSKNNLVPISEKNWRFNGFCDGISKLPVDQLVRFALLVCVDLQRGLLTAPALNNMDLRLVTVSDEKVNPISQIEATIGEGVGKFVDWIKQKFNDD